LQHSQNGCGGLTLRVGGGLAQEESVLREPVAWLWISLSGAKRGCLYKNCERFWGLCRQGPRSSGGAVGLEPLPGEKVGLLKGITGEGYEEEASGVVCLCLGSIYL
jgi:hypothetical protein